jgi:hypothetical protein
MAISLSYESMTVCLALCPSGLSSFARRRSYRTGDPGSPGARHCTGGPEAGRRAVETGGLLRLETTIVDAGYIHYAHRRPRDHLTSPTS